MKTSNYYTQKLSPFRMLTEVSASRFLAATSEEQRRAIAITRPIRRKILESINFFMIEEYLLDMAD